MNRSTDLPINQSTNQPVNQSVGVLAPTGQASARHGFSARGLVQWCMVVLVVCGACVMLLAMLLYGRFNRPGPEPDRSRVGESSGTVWTMPTTTPVNPTDLAARPLAQSGLEMLRAGADDIIAPPDAVMHRAIRKKMADGSADIITYTVKAKIADVEKFYCERLAKDGYKLLQRKPAMQEGGISLMFLRGMRRYSVKLQPVDKENKKTKIILVVAENDR